MKLVFLTQDSEIETLADYISGVEVVITDTLEGLEAEIEDERCIFFIDFDFDKKYAEKVNQELFEHENIRRVVISSGMRLKDLKKHQKGKHSAHGYLLKPLSLEIINGVLNDYELSDYLLDHQLEGEEVNVDEVDLTTFAASISQIKEFGFNPEVKAEMDKHSASGDADFKSETNKNIQAKFDDVFSDDSDDELMDFDIGDESDELPEFSEEGDEVDDIPTLSVNLEADAESDPDIDLGTGFKEGLSPEDGTGEFDIDTTLLEDESSSVEMDEVAMSSDDELDLDDGGLEFDDEPELDEGALEFDGPDDAAGSPVADDSTDSLDLSAGDDVSIDLGDDDLDLGDDIDVNLSKVEEEVEATGSLDLGGADLEFDTSDNSASSDSSDSGDEIEFGSDDSLDLGGDDLDLSGADSADGELDLGDETNPTIVTTSSNIQANDLSLDEDDMAEFSSQEAPIDDLDDATSTESESFDLSDDSGVDLDEEDDGGFSLDEEQTESTSSDLSFSDPVDNAGDENLTAATKIAATELRFGEDESEDDFSADLSDQSRSSSMDEPLPKGQMLGSLDQPELLRLQATIKQLREERSGMISQMDDLKSKVRLVQQDNLTLKAELEESKIEINILKKRHSEENEETKHRNRVLEERKSFFEEKSKTLQKEFDRLSQKIRIDFNKVKQREKELESQLELVTMDSQSQVKSRDMKILELKRKIDSLEFNMENATIREQKSREDKVKIEERLSKIMKTLRGSIQLLEDDIDLDEETRAQIEKARKL